MKELLYFSSSDLMTQVRYKQETNSLLYTSHRKLTFGERVIVEQYLLTNIAVKTDYYKKHPATLNYQGVKHELIKELNQFHLKNTLKNVKDKEQDLENKEQDAEDSIKSLIGRSMSNYYFEQIGNIILELRNVARDSVAENDKNLNGFKVRLEKLIEAYNTHSGKNVTYRQVIPKELIPLVHKSKESENDN